METDMNSGEQKIVLKTADPGILTDTTMSDLVTWYNEEIKENPWPLAVAVEFVFRIADHHGAETLMSVGKG